MNETNKSTCRCETCPQTGCTCGCQEAKVKTACACGPQCACGSECQCVNCQGRAK